MCRILLCNKKYYNNMGKDFMKTFLDHLEKECGGHSNGYAFINNQEVIDIDKGVKLTNQMIIDGLYEKQPEWLIYHTRIASVGKITDENAHPYWNADKSFVLCMNGTEHGIGDLAEGLGITDTNLIFMNLDTFNINEEVLTDLSSKFIGFRNGKVFVTNPLSTYGGLEYDDKNGICIASSFPITYKDEKKLKTGFIWREGDRLEEYVPVINRYYDNSYGWYDYYYNQQKAIKCEDNVCKAKTVSENSIYDVIDECNKYIENQQFAMKEIQEILEDKYGKDLKVQTTCGTRYIKLAQDFVFLVDNKGGYIY